MTRKLTLLLIILSSIITFGQEKKKQIEITYGAEKEIIPKVGDTIKEYYSNKKIREIKFRNLEKFIIQEFKEGGEIYKSTIFPIGNMKNKTLTRYHSNGNVILIANYNNGIVNGYFQKFYNNGKPMKIGNYKKMKKIGEWKYFNESGNLTKVENYENGKLIE
jgi:antitoxin component YwqK of YwqJK toxin-antitoxin module